MSEVTPPAQSTSPAETPVELTPSATGPTLPEPQPAPPLEAGPRVVIGSTVFLVGQACSTVIFAILGILVAPFPYRHRYKVITTWTRFNLWWLSVCCGLKHEIEGKENVPATPAVILCKHESAWETLALQTVFNPQSWVLKRELLWIPFFGWGLALLRPIAINRAARGGAIRDLIGQGQERLRSGIWIVVFPEGTRVPPGTRREYKKGGAILAKRADSVVVPVAHHAGDFWRRNSFLKYPGTIRLCVGPPIETADLSVEEINAAAEQWIETKVAALRSSNDA